jgi:hypothetical protein
MIIYEFNEIPIKVLSLSTRNNNSKIHIEHVWIPRKIAKERGVKATKLSIRTIKCLCGTEDVDQW